MPNLTKFNLNVCLGSDVIRLSLSPGKWLFSINGTFWLESTHATLCPFAVSISCQSLWWLMETGWKRRFSIYHRQKYPNISIVSGSSIDGMTIRFRYHSSSFWWYVCLLSFTFFHLMLVWWWLRMIIVLIMITIVIAVMMIVMLALMTTWRTTKAVEWQIVIDSLIPLMSITLTRGNLLIIARFPSQWPTEWNK